MGLQEENKGKEFEYWFGNDKIFRPGRRYNCFEKTDVSKESNVIATNLSKNVKLMLSRFDDYENKEEYDCCH
ncbi:hypothetical protein Bca52824_016662 [Brassica carinata]|uniref:Uncharacterized protein n=1 Tax=Brassica carinata TaxID=52824 RepID=A0A8X7W5J3_BRACI|nr:hypothetical protein Bca52824_016662 [Brassica carinata]